MLIWLKKNSLVLFVIAAILIWFAAGTEYASDTFEGKVSWGLFGRILGSWFFPLLLSVLWLKKEILQKVLAKFSFYVFLFVFAVAAVCFGALLYVGTISCEWCVSNDWQQAFQFYYLLAMPALCGVEISLSLAVVALFSIAVGFMKEKWFGVFEGKKNKIFLLVLLYLWVTFLPNLVQLANAM